MEKRRKNYIQSCEVSELAAYKLGGFSQFVLIEGKSRELPVVICLHGGPGSPVPFSVGARGMFPEWTDRAIMVYWDQLGCGKNNYKIDDRFHVEQYVRMTVDLISEIKAEFPLNKLYLLGVSWGSILALRAAECVGNEIDGVLVWGQVLKDLVFNDAVFSAFGDAPEKIGLKVRRIWQDGKNCSPDRLNKNIRLLSRLIMKYTDGYHNRQAESAAALPMGAFVKGLLTSPDYTLRDVCHVIKNGYSKNRSLWSELIDLNLVPCLGAVKVPYRILQGDTDIVTPTAVVSTALSECRNPNLSLKVVPRSGHLPSAAAMNEIFRDLFDMTERN